MATVAVVVATLIPLGGTTGASPTLSPRAQQWLLAAGDNDMSVLRGVVKTVQNEIKHNHILELAATLEGAMGAAINNVQTGGYPPLDKSLAKAWKKMLQDFTYAGRNAQNGYLNSNSSDIQKAATQFNAGVAIFKTLPS